MKTLSSLNVTSKRVLVRADFNVPIAEEKVMDDFRLSAYLPTIHYLQERGARIILLSHLGRPNGKRDERLSLRPVASRLSELGSLPVQFVADIIGEDARKAAQELQDGQIMMLENLRFDAREEANDEQFARELAALGEIYVDDGFSVCHRAHASIVGIPKFLPSAAGLLLEKEARELDRVRVNAEPPFVLIMGGAKVKTKLYLIKIFLEKVDAVCLGGILANTVLAAQGVAIGKSLFEKDLQQEAKELALTDTKLHLPIDVVVSTGIGGETPAHNAAVGNMKEDEIILDIGPDTIDLFSRIMHQAKTIVWNGPMGLFEVDKFAEGTHALAREFKTIHAHTVVGGGDVIRALDKIGMISSVNFVSTGGGAMLEYLAGEKLPGIIALD
ncbi:MAG: phosphoglycerate kinase [Candidatus Spechtbacteria bacterium]|nr:phosphoglycerate kinase [Candidatus Spechtbacteria bacterium]